MIKIIFNSSVLMKYPTPDNIKKKCCFFYQYFLPTLFITDASLLTARLSHRSSIIMVIKHERKLTSRIQR